jgi:hypothetical protein
MADPAPIDALLPQILSTLAHTPRLVLQAPPGAGKTTRVPLALLGAPWRGDSRILLLEPRRIAARAAAEFMAAQRGERVGDTVGYRIRFESKISKATRIEVVTEGILTRMIQDDPELPGVAAILFDEFHERHLHGDLGAALALDVQANLRPDLRLVVMSATLDGERIARWFDAPQLVSEGRSFPVRIAHPPARAGEAWPERGWTTHLRRATELALEENDGDVLAFLPGKREIDRAREALGAVAARGVESSRCTANSRSPNSMPRSRPPRRARDASCLRPTSPNRASRCPACAASSTSASRVSRASIRIPVSRDSMSSRRRKPPPTSAPAARDASAPAAHIACGRKASAWKTNVAPKSRKSNFRNSRSNSRHGDRTRCRGSTRRRAARSHKRATCCNSSARSTPTSASRRSVNACSRSARTRVLPRRCCART